MGVPLARRGLFESRTRIAVATGGVALAMMLVIALDGVFAGAMRGVTVYMDMTPFDLVVSQQGVLNMHMASSQFPLSDMDRIRRIPEVAQADPILFTTAFLVAGENRSLAYLIGFEDGKPGGPPASADVPRVLGKDEIIIDRRVALESGVSIGDAISVLGKDFRIAGIVSGTVSITNSIAYVRFADFEEATGLSHTASFGLVRVRRGDDPSAVARRIRDSVDEVSVQTKAQFADSERRIVSDMSTDILRLMTLIGFLIGLAVVGLTVYTATLGKLREYGVLKAIGAPSSRLFGVVFAQAVMSVALGLASALALTLALGAALRAADVNVQVVIEAPSVLRVAAGALVIAVAASALPIFRVAHIEPAEVFRR